MKEFASYHPIVNFTYFMLVIVFSCIFMHPVCLFISLFSSIIHMGMITGRKSNRFIFIYLPLLLAATTIINPLFNHEGITILAYFPDSNPLTLESVVYGFFSGIMIISVICHFSCYSHTMTSDKFIYLFGKILPSFSLILSMVLSFVPKFRTQIKKVSAAQKCIGRYSSGGIVSKCRHALLVLSIMVTWSLENAIETADSMKSRGYGLPGRSAFSNFKFDKRDAYAFIFLILSGLYILSGGINKIIHYTYFPYAKGISCTPYQLSVFAAYLLLFITPVIIECREGLKWKSLKQKI